MTTLLARFLRDATFCSFLLLCSRPALADVTIFSAGMEVPETISRIPARFGNHAGDYLVPDFRFGQGQPGHVSPIWRVPAAGGPPSQFTNVNMKAVGGTFLPTTFGDLGGEYLVVGWEIGATATTGRIVTIDSNGNATPFGSLSSGARLLKTPLIAPSSFGSFANQLIVTEQGFKVFAYDALGNESQVFDGFADYLTTGEFVAVSPFGAVFAPSDFGGVGDTLLVSGGLAFPQYFGNSLQIFSIDANGDATLFTNIPITQAQLDAEAGLRQLSIVPEGFGDLSGLLLVSVSGSRDGGGTLGQLLGLDEFGNVVKQLKLGSEFDKFDPRGHFFTDDGRILISDGSDPILIASPDDFVNVGIPVPEPCSIAVWTTLALVGWASASYRNRRIGHLKVNNLKRD